ncbi:hypothetical protein HELRODRAFT_70936, partial [Helobdella robusta]|uniref:CAAX prenyl protease 2 n=1 Tax=Helobdella robusta TaxID=6412 RepID=T1G0E5_HELRO
TVFELLGFTSKGLICALIFPLLHTVILFSGPLLQNYYNGVFYFYKSSWYWKSCFRNHVWLRSHLVGPISEEIVYRACMLPTLIPNFGVAKSIVLSPLFFGMAHFHHVFALVKDGMPLKSALIKACFQFTYTTLFGIYSAFVFVRTGDTILPCILSHMFCNHMGFPNFIEVLQCQDQSMKSKIIFFYVVGLVLFFILLVPLTKPSLYE